MKSYNQANEEQQRDQNPVLDEIGQKSKNAISKRLNSRSNQDGEKSGAGEGKQGGEQSGAADNKKTPQSGSGSPQNGNSSPTRPNSAQGNTSPQLDSKSNGAMPSGSAGVSQGGATAGSMAGEAAGGAAATSASAAGGAATTALASAAGEAAIGAATGPLGWGAMAIKSIITSKLGKYLILSLLIFSFFLIVLVQSLPSLIFNSIFGTNLWQAGYINDSKTSLTTEDYQKLLSGDTLSTQAAKVLNLFTTLYTEAYTETTSEMAALCASLSSETTIVSYEQSIMQSDGNVSTNIASNSLILSCAYSLSQNNFLPLSNADKTHLYQDYESDTVSESDIRKKWNDTIVYDYTYEKNADGSPKLTYYKSVTVAGPEIIDPDTGLGTGKYSSITYDYYYLTFTVTENPVEDIYSEIFSIDPTAIYNPSGVEDSISSNTTTNADFIQFMATASSELLYGADSGIVGDVGTGYANAAHTGDGSDMVALALQQVGRNNRTYLKYFGIHDYSTAWCAYFVSWCASQLGYTSLPDSNGNAGLGIMSTDGGTLTQWDFYKNLNPSSCVYSIAYGGPSDFVPQAGDLILYRWTDEAPNIQFSHIEIVQYCKDGYVYTVAGNSGAGSNATRVVKTNRYKLNSNFIKGFIVPTYPTSSSSNDDGT